MLAKWNDDDRSTPSGNNLCFDIQIQQLGSWPFVRMLFLQVTIAVARGRYYVGVAVNRPKSRHEKAYKNKEHIILTIRRILDGL
jgi:hypothetical protein